MWEESIVQPKPTVWVDLDATLAQYDHWRGLDHIGDPYDGAREFVAELRKDFRVGVLTTRTKIDMPERAQVVAQLREDATLDDVAEALAGRVRAWCERHGIVVDEVYTGQGKPFGLAYIDDRGVWCSPNVMGDAAYPIALEAVRTLAKPTNGS